MTAFSKMTREDEPLDGLKLEKEEEKKVAETRVDNVVSKAIKFKDIVFEYKYISVYQHSDLNDRMTGFWVPWSTSCQSSSRKAVNRTRGSNLDPRKMIKRRVKVRTSLKVLPTTQFASINKAVSIQQAHVCCRC